MRIGLIVPSTNTVAERDFQRHAPAGATVHTARMFISATTAEAEREMVSDHLPRAARDLGSCRPDVVVFSCTSAGAVLGHDGEQRMMEEVSEAANAPVVSTNAAVHEALAATGARRVAVLTAYIDDLTERIKAGIERSGVEVPVAAGMGVVDPFEICEIEPEDIVRLAEERVRGVEVDAIFVSCTNLRGWDAVDELKERFGVPVVTSNMAALRKALLVLNEEVAL